MRRVGIVQGVPESKGIEHATFRAIDGWRGVLANLVVLYHFTTVGHYYDTPFVKHGNIGLQLFFVLSGFVIMHGYGGRLADLSDVKKFTLRRLGRIYPLHIIVLACFVLLELAKTALVLAGVHAGQPPFSGTMSPAHLLSSIVMTNGVGLLPDSDWNRPAWTLGAEVASYIVFSVVCLAFPRRLFPLAATAICLVAGFVLLRNDALATATGVTPIGEGFWRCLFGFFVGALTYLIYRRIRETREEIWGGWEWIAVGLILACYLAGAFYGRMIIASLMFGAFMLIFAFEAGAVTKFMTSPVPATLGRLSFSMYMIHMLLLVIANGALRVAESVWGLEVYAGRAENGSQIIAIGGPWAMDLAALLFIVVTVGLSALTMKYVELPGRRFFNRLADGRSFAEAARAAFSKQQVKPVAQPAAPPRAAS